MSDVFKVAVAGLGTVGGGVVKVLLEQKEILEKRCGKAIELVAVSDLNEQLYQDLNLSPAVLFFKDVREMIATSNADLIVELMGGADGIAYEICLNTLKQGKAFVTANKAMIAHHGNELAKLAEENNAFFGFEAAVAGGIPVIKAVREGLIANKVSEVYGILNGTCNYILTEMQKTKAPFESVLADAQKLGYAEADPSFDIDGVDTAHKTSILGALAFGMPIDLNALSIEGIRNISDTDISYAEELGFRIKLLGVGRQSEKGVSLNVYPCMLPDTAEIASVDGVYNAVITQSDFLGSAMFVGRGAGERPTASAVVADIADAVMNKGLPLFTVKSNDVQSVSIVPLSERIGEYYVRFEVQDKVGVVAEIAKILANSNVSIESMIQRDKRQNGAVPLIMTFQKSLEASVTKALKEIEALDCVLDTPCLIRIERL